MSLQSEVGRVENSNSGMRLLITKIIGGLGNQMFQYAAGRALALTRGLSLRLDTTGFDGYGLHQGFELQRVFCCDTALASADEVRTVLGWRAPAIMRRMLARPELAALRGQAFVVEPHFHYWSGITSVPGQAYIHGYWQSEKYFADAMAAIRTDFTFCQPMSPTNALIAEKIDAAGTAVSLHVRRGDYLTDVRTHAAHGVCSPDYYRAAVQYVAERVEAPEFFIFSDDISWARASLELDYRCHFIDHNRGAESYNDMRLMSLCRHHIIANSSFSWWGAWLNPSRDKMVIAPKRWFAKQDKNIVDLFPAGWTTV